MSVRGHRQRKSLKVNTDLKLMPLMNIIIALIPMLLLSAVFIEVKVIETSLPRDAEPATAEAQPPATPPLDLAVHVRADVYVVEAGGVMNAFATRFLGRNFVVIHSDVLALAMEQGEAAVGFIVAHTPVPLLLPTESKPGAMNESRDFGRLR